MNVMIHIVLPIGAPRMRFAIGGSVSCHVHQRNLAPTMSYGA